MFSWVILAIVALFSAISIYYNYKFAMIILRTQDSLENSLDILDERYDSMSRILEIPIFHDSVEVRQVIKDIEVSRESILEVARQLTLTDIGMVEENPEQLTEEEKVA